MSDYKIEKIYGYERELMTNLIMQDTQMALLEDDICRFSEGGLISQELFRIGDRLDALEKELGKNDEQVISLKKYYTILELKDYLYFKKVNKECSAKFILNLFFYSNDPKKCEKCEDQGFVLSYVRAKNENMRTYSFDTDLDLPLVKYLINYYNIEEVPTLIFNEEKYTGYMTTEQIEEILLK